MSEKKKLSKIEIANLYSQQYNQQLQNEMIALAQQVGHERIMGRKKEMSWNNFWQVFNQLFNAKRWDKLLIHLISNYNPKWNRGQDLKYNPKTKIYKEQEQDDSEN